MSALPESLGLQVDTKESQRLQSIGCGSRSIDLYGMKSYAIPGRKLPLQVA